MKKVTVTVRDIAKRMGAKGGAAGTGTSKRRDQDDPDYYKRISAKAAEARKRNAKKK